MAKKKPKFVLDGVEYASREELAEALERGGPPFEPAWSDEGIAEHSRIQNAASAFFSSELGQLMLASLTWRKVSRSRQRANVRTGRPVLRCSESTGIPRCCAGRWRTGGR